MKSFTIPVAHVDYRVVFQKVVKHNGKSVHGLCDPAKRLIRIEIKTNVDFMRQTIWHEWIHAFHYEVGQVIDGVNETVTDCEATAIMRVRLQCPWL